MKPEQPKEKAPRRAQRADPPPAFAFVTCSYCRSEQREDMYKHHLLEEHSDYLFQCEECDTYVDRKKLIIHMSLHYLQNCMIEKNKSLLAVKRETSAGNVNENVQPEPPAREDEETSAAARPVVKSEPTNTAPVEEAPQNEFSDQSDVEVCFEPLPESVFEAIDDSEDERPPVEEENSAEREPDAAAAEETEPDRADDDGDAQVEPEPEKKEERHKKTRVCTLCAKKYTASSSYFYHMKYFHRQCKEHECPECGRKFGTRAALAAHGTVHSGERALPCTRCDKSFPTRASLYIHAQTHAESGAAPAARCDECGRTFRWRGSLRRHQARHEATRAHSCAACGRGFSVRSDLARHMRTHAAGAVACDTCGATFAQPRYLRVHMQKKHAQGATQTAGSAA